MRLFGFLTVVSVLPCRGYRFISMKKGSAMSALYTPATVNQKTYVDLLKNTGVPVIAGVGPAGCGKTLFACNAAIESLKSGVIQKIIITRPLVSVDEEELGFLPGSVANKMDPWTRPIFDIFGEYYSNTQIKDMVRDGIIEISPLAFMRGRTFKKSFIIADEMQNSSPTQMLMVLTRIGEGSKLVITGDLKQSDRNGLNGLDDFLRKVKSKEGGNELIRYVELNSTDIQRSVVVSHILDLYSMTPVEPKVLAPVEPKVQPTISSNDAALIPAGLLNKYML